MAPRFLPARVWIQAASAGEAFLALSIIEQLAPAAPLSVLVTATTDQGLAILKTGLAQNPCHPLVRVRADLFPFDIPATMDAAVTAVAPDLMVLLETELWPALLFALKKRGTRVILINARLSRRSGARYKMTRRFWKALAPDQVLAISEKDRERYQRVFETTPIETMANIKFDLMGEDTRACPPALEADLISRNLPLSILASFRRQEEALVLDLVKDLRSRIPAQVIALFPRHMHRVSALGKRLDKAGIPFVLKSSLKGPLTAPTVILWDRFGELRQAYGLADAVFVGGSLVPLGGQNFLEPVVLGVPTVIGPHWEDFSWVGEKIFDLGFVSCQKDVPAVARAMAAHLEAREDKEPNRGKALAYIKACSGGTQTACKAILKALDRPRT